MPVRKRYNRRYYTDFYFRGKRIVRKIPGGISHQGVAQQWEDHFKLRLLRGEIGLTENNPDLPGLIGEYLEYSQTNKAPSSFRRDELALRTFQTVSGITRFSDLVPLAVERYKAERSRTVSKRTVNLEVTVLKTMLNRYVELGTIPVNPIRAVKKIRGPESKPIEFLTKQEVEALLRALTPAFRPMIYTYLKTGLRRNELVFLEWNDINFEKKLIRVINKQAHPTKSYRERHIPMDDKLTSLLLSLPRAKNNPYVFTTQQNTQRKNNLVAKLKKAAKRAGIQKNVTVHSLRHSFASNLVMAGVDLATVKELLGHADIHTTMRYAHLAPDHLQEAVTKLPF